MPRNVTKATVNEVSLVDRPANEYAQIEIAKRDDHPTPFEAREAALQAIADVECRKMLAKAATDTAADSLSEYDRYRIALFKSAPRGAPRPAVPPADPEYSALMKRAHFLAEEIGVTPAQAFEAIYTSPGEVEKRTRKARLVPGNNEPDTDDGDDPADAGDGAMDDADSGSELGPPRGPRGGAGIQSGGRSTGTYAASGENVIVHGPKAVAGRTEASYDPSRRPARALKSLKRQLKDVKKLRKQARRLAAG